MECSKEKNLTQCNCTYEPCSRKGVCCQCVEYHRKLGELPACYFDSQSERTYNRSIEYFVELNKR